MKVVERKVLVDSIHGDLVPGIYRFAVPVGPGIWRIVTERVEEEPEESCYRCGFGRVVHSVRVGSNEVLHAILSSKTDGVTGIETLTACPGFVSKPKETSESERLARRVEAVLKRDVQMLDVTILLHDIVAQLRETDPERKG
jgi:hypothetical protein